MTPTKWTTLTLCALWCCCSLPATAAGPGGIPDGVLKTLKAMDRDHDNRLSYDEIAKGYRTNEKRLMARFKKADRNGNGTVDKGEVGPILFRRFDLDKNGSIRPDEYMAASSAKARQFVTTTDADKDGYITVDELNAGVDKAIDNAGASYDEMAAAYTQNPARRKQLFKSIDKDGNGSLQPAEWPEAKSFAAVDTNHDGRIAEKEFMAAHAALSAALVKSVDLNQDGKVTIAEIRQQAKKAQAKHP